MTSFFTDTALSKDLGLFVIRMGVGLIFMKSGFDKIMGGTQTWLWLGQQLSYVGITFLPLWWGLLATCAEFFGGIALVAGIYTRFAAFLISDVMIIALIMHFSVGDPFKVFYPALSFLFVLVGLIIAGGGAYQLTR